jgi:hypothetical protein
LSMACWLRLSARPRKRDLHFVSVNGICSEGLLALLDLNQLPPAGVTPAIPAAGPEVERLAAIAEPGLLRR